MKNIHFVHGLEDPELELCDRLAIASAWDHNPDYTVHLWAPQVPTGPHWDALTKRVPVKLMPIDNPLAWNGNNVRNYQHRADLIRHTVLYTMGGVYCDTDTLTLRPFPAHWTEYDTVIGVEFDSQRVIGLCNAIMCSQMHSRFQWRWLQKWQEFDGTGWNEISVQYPLQLHKEFPDSVLAVRREMLGFQHSELGQYWSEDKYDLGDCVIAHLWRTYARPQMLALTEDEIRLRKNIYTYHAANHL